MIMNPKGVNRMPLPFGTLGKIKITEKLLFHAEHLVYSRSDRAAHTPEMMNSTVLSPSHDTPTSSSPKRSRCDYRSEAPAPALHRHMSTDREPISSSPHAVVSRLARRCARISSSMTHFDREDCICSRAAAYYRSADRNTCRCSRMERFLSYRPTRALSFASRKQWGIETGQQSLGTAGLATLLP